MRSDEYVRHDALSLAALVASGEAKARELLDAALAVADARNPELNAIVHPLHDEARQAIDAGLPAGPLSGVPFLLKDLNLDYAGAPTSQGSRFFADAVADHDAELTARYRRAGLVIFGKTNTPELGLAPSTEPELFGPTRNPWNRTHSSGGSSGGAAAAVAAGIVPVAHASDGGGSIRIPTSCCGLVDLKPTRARTPAGPDRGEGWNGMSMHHVVSRTVRDSAAVLDVTHGPMPGDPYAAPPSGGSYTRDAATDPQPLRIGLVHAPPSGTDVDPRCIAAVDDAARLCESLGHHVEPITMPPIGDDVADVQATVIGVNIATVILNRAAVVGREPGEDEIEAFTRLMLEAGRAVPGTRYVQAVQKMHKIGRIVDALHENFDVLCMPTMAALPAELGVLRMDDVKRFLTAIGGYTPFTVVQNISGQPAISLPLGEADGLPIGTMFVGRFGDERTLFRLAGQLERAAPWLDRLPLSV